MPIKLLSPLHPARACLHSPSTCGPLGHRVSAGGLVRPPQIRPPPLPPAFVPRDAVLQEARQWASLPLARPWFQPQGGRRVRPGSVFLSTPAQSGGCGLAGPGAGGGTSRVALPPGLPERGSRLSANPGFTPSQPAPSMLHHMTYIFPPSCPNLCRRSFH